MPNAKAELVAVPGPSAMLPAKTGQPQPSEGRDQRSLLHNPRLASINEIAAAESPTCDRSVISSVAPGSFPNAADVLATSLLSASVDPKGQDLLSTRRTALFRTLLNQTDKAPSTPQMASMVRKIWVKRPGASATLVPIHEEDMVDDVRDMILRKYANSLGRQFDAPDLIMRIVPRELHRQERTLGPDEPMARTLDAYYPGGQTIDEALVIDVPLRARSPKPSPRYGPPQIVHHGHFDEPRPSEAAVDYFGPGAMAHVPMASNSNPQVPHSIAVLNTGQVPLIPSPGGTRSRTYRERPDRPRLGRQHTSSPTILNMVSPPNTAHVATANNTAQATRLGRHRAHSSAASEAASVANVPTVPGIVAPPPPALPTPPAPSEPATMTAGVAAASVQRTATPPPVRVSSPRPPSTRLKKKKALDTASHPTLPTGMLQNGGVPPINVLIVEDNIINLRLLEAFVKRLKVRWQTAMDGAAAVEKWRQGGFHLVLMDIQLPVMSGLEATREIRRLERENHIGVFSSTSAASDAPPSLTQLDANDHGEELAEADRLVNTDLFKSPVIIVALTASSLQSDRHEALAAGCNDFLTKPVNFDWLQRKVMEWGCMQALIDFDGWRKWKDFSQQAEQTEAAKKAAASKTRTRKTKQSSS